MSLRARTRQRPQCEPLYATERCAHPRRVTPPVERENKRDAGSQRGHHGKGSYGRVIGLDVHEIPLPADNPAVDPRCKEVVSPAGPGADSDYADAVDELGLRELAARIGGENGHIGNIRARSRATCATCCSTPPTNGKYRGVTMSSLNRPAGASPVD